MDKLYKQFPWKTKKKWIDSATRHGFDKSEASKYFDRIEHDFQLKLHDNEFLPIFSRKTKCYQFDTLIQGQPGGNETGPPWLEFVNPNSRKGYVYLMKNKSAAEVLKALEAHLKKVGTITEFTSDEDAANLSKEIQDFMLANHINHFATEVNNHHILGIVNRFIKTIRDLNSDKKFRPKICIRL
jgi:hypothetical protein